MTSLDSIDKASLKVIAPRATTFALLFLPFKAFALCKFNVRSCVMSITYYPV